MRKALSLVALSLFAATALSACAPRMNKTHFARWADQDQKRREENAAEEKVEAWMRAQAGVATPADAKTGTGAPASTPRMTTGGTSNQNSRDTPPITATSTRSSRVIKPSEQPAEDDEAIY